MALRRSLLPRRGNAETITALQQWLLLHIMNHEQFDIVDLIFCEWEDAIFDAMSAQRQQPYAHLISWLIVDLKDGKWKDELYSARGQFGTYLATRPNDKRRCPRAMLAAEERLQQQVIAEAAMTELERERDALATVEAQLPSYFDSNNDDSNEDPDFAPYIPERRTHDDESGPSRAVPTQESSPPPLPVTPPPRVSEAHTTQLDALAAIVQSLADQQRRSEAEHAPQRDT